MPQPTRRYKDLDLDFLINPGTKDLSYLTDDAAIKRSVRNIVLTSIFERHFDDSFGCAVKVMLFENISDMTTIGIQSSISSVLTNYETRIDLLNVQVDADIDNNGYNITIWFKIRNQINPVKINFFLERVR